MCQKQFFLILVILFSYSCTRKEVEPFEIKDTKTGNKIIASGIIKGKDTILQGQFLIYNKSKHLILKCNYKNNKVDGLAYSYNDNGVLKIICNMSNGYKEGKSTSYYENGTIRTIETYRKGTIYGNTISYYQNKQLDIYVLWDSLGRAMGEIKFDETGKIHSKEGKLVNCFLDTDRIKEGEKFKMDCLLADIPNATRKVKFIYSDSSLGERKIQTTSVNYLKVEELKYKKGKNVLYVIVEYQFNQKYFNQVLKDTAFVRYSVK